MGEHVAIQFIRLPVRIVHHYTVNSPSLTLFRHGLLVEVVLFHMVSGAVVQTQSASVGGKQRRILQIEITPGHRDELVAVDAHPRGVVLELRLVHRHRELVAGGVHLDGRGEAGEHAFSRIIMALAVNGGQVGGASGPHFHARVLGINAATVGHGTYCLVLERAAPEFHPSHVPQFHMLGEGGAVGGKQVGRIHREGAPLEGAHVVGNGSRRRMVRVGVDLHGAAVVGEVRAVGDYYAAGGGERRVPAQPRADTAEGVLNPCLVAQLHLALVLRQLPLGAVARDLDALPHLACTGTGQCAAIDDELAAGTDDEAGVVSAMNGIGDSENSSGIND